MRKQVRTDETPCDLIAAQAFSDNFDDFTTLGDAIMLGGRHRQFGAWKKAMDSFLRADGLALTDAQAQMVWINSKVSVAEKVLGNSAVANRLPRPSVFIEKLQQRLGTVGAQKFIEDIAEQGNPRILEKLLSGQSLTPDERNTIDVAYKAAKAQSNPVSRTPEPPESPMRVIGDIVKEARKTKSQAEAQGRRGTSTPSGKRVVGTATEYDKGAGMWDDLTAPIRERVSDAARNIRNGAMRLAATSGDLKRRYGNALSEADLADIVEEAKARLAEVPKDKDGKTIGQVATRKKVDEIGAWMQTEAERIALANDPKRKPRSGKSGSSMIDQANVILDRLGSKEGVRRGKTAAPLVDAAAAEYAKGARSLAAFNRAMYDKYGDLLGTMVKGDYGTDINNPDKFEGTVDELLHELFRKATADYKASPSAEKVDEIKTKIAELMAREEYHHKSMLAKFGINFRAGIEFAQNSALSMDLGASLRQGLNGLLISPSSWAKGMRAQIGASGMQGIPSGVREFNKSMFGTLPARIKNNGAGEVFKVWKGAQDWVKKLDEGNGVGEAAARQAQQGIEDIAVNRFGDPDEFKNVGLNIGEHSEGMHHTLAWTKTIKAMRSAGIEGSDRAMTTLLNVIRADLYSKMATPDMELWQRKLIANAINVMMGQGELPPKLAAVADLARFPYLAPRYVLAQVQMQFAWPLVKAAAMYGHHTFKSMDKAQFKDAVRRGAWSEARALMSVEDTRALKAISSAMAKVFIGRTMASTLLMYTGWLTSGYGATWLNDKNAQKARIAFGPEAGNKDAPYVEVSVNPDAATNRFVFQALSSLFGKGPIAKSDRWKEEIPQGDSAAERFSDPKAAWDAMWRINNDAFGKPLTGKDWLNFNRQKSSGIADLAGTLAGLYTNEKGERVNFYGKPIGNEDIAQKIAMMPVPIIAQNMIQTFQESGFTQEAATELAMKVAGDFVGVNINVRRPMKERERNNTSPGERWREKN